MPLDSSYAKTRLPDFYVKINSWTLVTNSATGDPAIYLYSDGTLRIQIVPRNSNIVFSLQPFSGSSSDDLLTITSDQLDIISTFYPYITACDEIIATIYDIQAYQDKGNYADITWKFVKKA